MTTQCRQLKYSTFFNNRFFKLTVESGQKYLPTYNTPKAKKVIFVHNEHHKCDKMPRDWVLKDQYQKPQTLNVNYLADVSNSN